MRKFINIVESAQQRYIRFGDIPEDERSTIGKSPNIYAHIMRTSDKEHGVSVFDAEWSEDMQRWAIVNVGNYASLDGLLAQHRPAFLVTGREVGEGIDGEPVLRDVQIIEQLPYNELWVPGWGRDPLPEEYL